MHVCVELANASFCFMFDHTARILARGQMVISKLFSMLCHGISSISFSFHKVCQPNDCLRMITTCGDVSFMVIYVNLILFIT